MSRPITLSNGEMHVGLDSRGIVQDFYYPYVGLENHTLGSDTRHRVGVWVDGTLSWIDDGSWDTHLGYQEEALIGKTKAINRELKIELRLNDTIDSEVNAFMRNIHVVNLSDETRDVRVFMHQAFVIGDSRGHTDTAQYLPDSKAILHYRGRRAFVISAESNGVSFDQHSIGLFGTEGREGTYKDAEDGELGMSNVEHGQVDSTLRLRFEMGPQSSEQINYSISAGTSHSDAIDVNKLLKEEGVVARLKTTSEWWRKWVKPASRASASLSPARRQQFIRSVMLLKSHIDKRGAVIASTDSSMLNCGRDAYAYTWPRDTAYTLWPLIRLGYTEEPRAVFDFYRRALHTDGYLSHKYRVDGAIGGSWHPYVHKDGIIAAPIQTDETAVMLFMFTQFYNANISDSLLSEYYESYVKPMASFLARYIDSRTSLPRPSYDLWGERFMTATYTTAVTYAALLAAAELAEAASDNESAVSWRTAAGDMQSRASEQLYDKDKGCLNRGYLMLPDDSVEIDATVDVSSLFGAFMYGLFPIDSPEITSSFKTLRATFDQANKIGLPRYENDAYGRPHEGVPSNYWPVATLWHAQYCIEAGDTDMAERIVEWIEKHSYESGIIAEQIMPLSGYSTSVAPLTWSHAEYVATILDLLGDRKLGKLDSGL